jgi:hypothetical protein
MQGGCQVGVGQNRQNIESDKKWEIMNCVTGMRRKRKGISFCFGKDENRLRIGDEESFGEDDKQ